MEGIKRDFHSRYDWEGYREGLIDGIRIQDAWAFDERVKNYRSKR